jgi:hypothetical protein
LLLRSMHAVDSARSHPAARSGSLSPEAENASSIQTAKVRSYASFSPAKNKQNPRPNITRNSRPRRVEFAPERVEPGIRTSSVLTLRWGAAKHLWHLAAWRVPWQISHHSLNTDPDTQRQVPWTNN